MRRRHETDYKTREVKEDTARQQKIFHHRRRRASLCSVMQNFLSKFSSHCILIIAPTTAQRLVFGPAIYARNAQCINIYPTSWKNPVNKILMEKHLGEY